MAQIIDRPKITEITNDNVFLLDGPNGTETISSEDLAKALAGMLSAKELVTNINFNRLPIHEGDVDKYYDSFPIITMYQPGGTSLERINVEDAVFKSLDAVIDSPVRRTIWRGKDLGTSYTNDQKLAVKNGTFKDLFLGDYWVIDGRIYRIVDFDYWWNTGDTPCTTHHLVVMPDVPYEGEKMNDTDTTRGGYYDSDMRRGLDPRQGQASPIYDTYHYINDAFGEENILTHRENFTNAVTNGYPSGGIWTDSRIALPNEIMIYGTNIFAPMGNGTTIPANYTIDKTQLAGFKVNPNLILKGKVYYWLRDVVSDARFASVDTGGRASAYGPSNVRGVRPVFGLTGDTYINPPLPPLQPET